MELIYAAKRISNNLMALSEDANTLFRLHDILPSSDNTTSHFNERLLADFVDYSLLHDFPTNLTFQDQIILKVWIFIQHFSFRTLSARSIGVKIGTLTDYDACAVFRDIRAATYFISDTISHVIAKELSVLSEKNAAKHRIVNTPREIIPKSVPISTVSCILNSSTFPLLNETLSDPNGFAKYLDIIILTEGSGGNADAYFSNAICERLKSWIIVKLPCSGLLGLKPHMICFGRIES